MRNEILSSLDESLRIIQTIQDQRTVDFIDTASRRIAACFKQGGKILLAGNGGSLCDAAHFAEELTGYYRAKRAALPAIALNDVGHITCVANDLSYDEVFARSVEALAKKQDLLIVLTTSGNSKSIVQAVKKAKEMGIETIAFLGKNGGALKGVCELEWIVEGFGYSDRIQEAHMAVIHIIIEMIEKILFSDQKIALLESLLPLKKSDVL